ncbi:hypothetical protein HAX54_017270, partial [Datura stramonium]|nr:hypothetical protein [Datura stramonium]
IVRHNIPRNQGRNKLPPPNLVYVLVHGHSPELPDSRPPAARCALGTGCLKHQTHSEATGKDAMKQSRHGSDTICYRGGVPARSAALYDASPLRSPFLAGTIYWFRPASGSSGERLQFPSSLYRD